MDETNRLETRGRSNASRAESAEEIPLDGNALTLETLGQITRQEVHAVLSDSARSRMERAREVVDRAIQSGEHHYSINTGFGILSKVKIDARDLEDLQLNLIRSHCVGVGEPHTEAETRAILCLRANVLAKAYSGTRPLVVDTLLAMLNAGVHPIIPCKGSVGASGDLAPLAHLASVLIGEGEAIYLGRRMNGAAALKAAGIAPVQLAPKEGLSLINGTQQMTGIGALLLLRAKQLADTADIVCAASLEGILGTPRAYADWLQEARPFEGQRRSAELLRKGCADSEIFQSHETCDRIQDPYSYRCAPQVHGACRDLLSVVEKTIAIELNAATDNPLINVDTGEIVSNGNFHGQPVAFALDILTMALCEWGSLAERRISKLIDPNFSELPAFLVKREGLNSGFMMAHVTAASLVSESRLLSHPASTDSIPTNNEKEDHVSMGPWAARKAKTVLENTETILAIEALCAAQALDLRLPLKGNRAARFLHKQIRKVVEPLERDRAHHEDIQRATDLLRGAEFASLCEKEGLL